MSEMPPESVTQPAHGERIRNAFLEFLPVRLAKLRAVGLRCEPGVVVKTPTRLKLGSNVVLQRYSILHCGGRKWSDYKGGIDLGENVVIGPNCILYGAGTILIGDFTHLGPGSMIMTQSGNTLSSTRLSTTPGHIVKPVVLGKGVWVGAGAVILGGTTLGDNCIVGPNSVVQGNYGADTSLLGNPARTVMRRSDKIPPQ